MFSDLQEPAYQHVLLNHFPIVGSVLGALALLVGLLLRNRLAVMAPLVLLLVVGVSAWPAYQTGSDAYKPVRKVADKAGVDWLDEHMERADKTVWIFYAMAVIAAAALVVPKKWPRSSNYLAIGTLLAALGASATGAYIASAGGKIRHPEFRTSELPPPTEETDHHHHD